MFSAFIHGIILAFGLIIPLGVQNVFIFNQGVTHPTLIYALPSVFTAFICDVLLIILAVLGVSLIVLQFVWLKTILLLLGCGFLGFMGWVTWKTSSEANSHQFKAFSLKRQVYFAVSVSLLNPHAILDTIGVIGVSSLSYVGRNKVAFSIGCILVSFIWFMSLAVIGNVMKKVNSNGIWLNLINKFSAIIIWDVGVYLAWQLVGILKELTF